MIQGLTKDSLTVTKDNLSLSSLSYSHVFTEHGLKPKNTEAIQRHLQVSAWPVFVLLFALSILVYLRANNARNFFQVLQSFFSLSYTKQLVREEYRLNKSTSIALITLFIISSSLFFIKVNAYYGFFTFNTPPFLQFSFLCFIITLIYLFKIIIHKILAFIVRDNAKIDEYVFNVFIMNKAVGFFLFPIVIGLYYTSIKEIQLILSGLCITAYFYGVRIYRGISIGYTNNGFSVFHLFLYLCTLELLPLAVFLKLLVNRF